MHLSAEIFDYIDRHRQQALELLCQLARIPAPSNHEQERAAFCRDWLERQGAKGVYIDEALNVIYPVGCDGQGPLVVLMAHSDLVFPDTTPLPLSIEDGCIRCPGIGDDTANVAALMMTARYIARQELTPRGRGVLIVINSGEEGLGNLKGCRAIMERFGHRVEEVISFDCINAAVVDRAVGSKRYRIEVRTEGGHSFRKFGNRNAIAYLASMIDSLYTMKVPELGTTTYNVGTIRGGTSVNTIAQQAEMLYEFRSDERESLHIMEKHLDALVELYRAKGVEVLVEQIGDRPCMGDVPAEKQRALARRAGKAVTEHFGLEAVFESGSTDCNIPLSMGIPSVCVGCCIGEGAHTRDEYLKMESLLPGLRLAFDMVLHYF